MFLLTGLCQFVWWWFGHMYCWHVLNALMFTLFLGHVYVVVSFVIWKTFFFFFKCLHISQNVSFHLVSPLSSNRETNIPVCSRSPSWHSARPLSLCLCSHVISCRFGTIPVWLHLFWKENDHCFDMIAPRHLTVHTNPSLGVDSHPVNPAANMSQRLSGSAVLPISTHTWQALKIQHKPAHMLMVAHNDKPFNKPSLLHSKTHFLATCVWLGAHGRHSLML